MKALCVRHCDNKIFGREIVNLFIYLLIIANMYIFTSSGELLVKGFIQATSITATLPIPATKQ